MRRTIFYIIVTLIIAWVTGLIAYDFMQGVAFQTYLNWARQNIVFYVGVLIFLKFLSVIYPPLPSIVLTLSAIPIIGWFNAYLIDFIGSILGSSISYWIAKRYGISLLSKILDRNTVRNLSRVKLKEGREIEGIVVLRLLTGATIIEAVSYGAGLLKVPYWKFLTGFVISHPLLGIPTFYIAKNVLQQGNVILFVALVVSGTLLLYVLRNRYFEKE